MPDCHFGVFFGGFGLPRAWRRRRPTTTSATPIRILTTRAAVAGAVFDFGGSFPVAAKVIATTAASDPSQPRMKAAPFRTPFFEAKISTKAVRGIGSSVMTSPIRMRSSVMNLPPPPEPQSSPSRSVHLDHPPSLCLARPVPGQLAAGALNIHRTPNRSRQVPQWAPQNISVSPVASVAPTERSS